MEAVSGAFFSIWSRMSEAIDSDSDSDRDNDSDSDIDNDNDIDSGSHLFVLWDGFYVVSHSVACE